ncbi:MAG: hypothetical protein K2Q06_13920 [Parvularculaceae bacterium]|nr:hypothetical protein [Parvularculaceae bacterium]
MAAFERRSVRFLVIGGYAVGFHVEPRYTKDIDFWIATDRLNAEAVHAALREFGAPLHGEGPEVFEDDDAFYFFGEPPNRVDILMGPPGGVAFDDAWSRRITEIVQGVQLHFCARDDLIALKWAAGRAIDKRDLRALRDSDPTKKTRRPRKKK